ncbi:MAG: hypothetical protein JO301_11135 [Chitinophagaceae bacterium]|nr:hypothetical protein [Chitinophagaceae bacterium]
MKRVFGLAASGILLLSACSKKNHPVASKTPVRSSTHAPAAESRQTESPAVINIPHDIPPAPARNMAMAPMIVIDEQGQVITSREKLPADIASKVDYGKISRGYTPAQRQNLVYRFKLVPPRVLYVPEQFATKNAKGTYVVYRKKFFYWKKADGLFHIDQTYYE